MIELGIAPIGWTNDDLPEIGGDITFEQCISEMALAGYKGCEVGTKFPKNNEGLIRVSFGSFNTKEDAVIALRSIRDNENKYAWILTKTN